MNDAINRRLGDFEIVRELGRGGMGVVYEARQISLNRRVALKVLSGGLGLTPKAVQRFQREAEAAAKLHHTNIVPVYAIGEVDGTHFYAMELIDGPSLDHVIRQMRQGTGSASRTLTSPRDGVSVSPDLAQTGPYVQEANISGITSGMSSSSLDSGSGHFDAVARMLAEVADALDYAHKEGVIHRDIKPSNLLLSPSGRLSVNDFGLARMLEQPGMTVTGEFVGTPAYMSPEQITAGRTLLDHRTDIYSLGATLYELLTLHPPFTGERRDQMLTHILHKEPKPPRKLNAKVPRDLETICLKCLEKDPDRRYQTAGALAEDLRRYLNRFAISARRAGPLTKLKKWVKRHPGVAVLVGCLFVAVLMTGFFAWQAHEAEQQRRADERKRGEEAIAEKRQAAMERGMTAALAADLTAAEKAVAAAELFGASAGGTRLLRGFIALFHGRSPEAIAHLEQAVRLMPESVSARALLASAHAAATDWPAFERVLEEAAALPLRTPEDKLFLGHAIGARRPIDGLPLTDQALAERPSGIGHVLRAGLRQTLAEFSGAVADAEAALVDAELAKRLLPSNPFSLSAAAVTHLTAAVNYKKAGRPDKWNEHMDAARREADALAKFPNSYRAYQSRHRVAMVGDGLDGRVDMIAALRQVQANAPKIAIAYYEGYDLFCLGREAEAGKAADRFPNDRLTGHIRFMVALGRRDGRADARRAWEVLAGPNRMAYYRLEVLPLLFAVGTADEVAAISRDLRAGGDPLRYGTYSATDLAAMRAFLEGTASEADLLAHPVSNEVERCRRHYTIGWKRLGAGDRIGAKAAFREAYKVMPFEAAPWVITRAVLIRMKNPDWPQAIPKK
ncbi:MAG TPA: serine/threonine-protein kinase [Gemmataceae bacterium]|nr:serine/threonine-protein kinase [Gemmataceae bacterium]